MSQSKPFTISKHAVWKAFKQVKANRGAAGVDGQSIEAFEENLKGNLYKLWNRLASGSYMPSAVRRVEIPKASGGMRPLGIPTVADRIAQMVVTDTQTVSFRRLVRVDRKVTGLLPHLVQSL